MINVKNEQGFTLIELILVVAILGILAVAVAPQVGNIMANSQTRSRQGTVGMVQSAVNTSFSNALANTGVGAWPANLDNEADGYVCSAAPTGVGCFGSVLAQPIRSADWRKTNGTTYQHIPSATNAVYAPGTGQFQ